MLGRMKRETPWTCNPHVETGECAVGWLAYDAARERYAVGDDVARATWEVLRAGGDVPEIEAKLAGMGVAEAATEARRLRSTFQRLGFVEGPATTDPPSPRLRSVAARAALALLQAALFVAPGTAAAYGAPSSR